MVQSVLELRRGRLPFPHGDPAGQWRYRHAIRPEGPTELDHQTVSDFVTYEAQTWAPSRSADRTRLP
jgi:hypothetical protein